MKGVRTWGPRGVKQLGIEMNGMVGETEEVRSNEYGSERKEIRNSKIEAVLKHRHSVVVLGRSADVNRPVLCKGFVSPLGPSSIVTIILQPGS